MLKQHRSGSQNFLLQHESQITTYHNKHHTETTTRSTVLLFPTDAKSAGSASQGQELLGEHVLGSTITGSGGTKGPGRGRFLAQLGVVMVLSQDRKDWHTTEFVFAAELDEGLDGHIALDVTQP